MKNMIRTSFKGAIRTSFNGAIRTVTAAILLATATASLAAAADVREVTVFTRGVQKPIAYFDDKDRLTGFDIELLREIEKRNPSVKFNFKTMSLSAAFVALDNNQGDLIAHQMVKNPQREAKYLYPSEVNNYTSTRLAVREDNTDIQSLDDLRGKKIVTNSLGETAKFLRDYNEDHKVGMDIIYTDKGSEETLNLLTTGRVDAAPEYEFTARAAKQDLGLKIKLVGPVLLSDETFFILRKSPENEELVKIIDATLKDFRADGTLKALTEQFFGADYSVPQK